MTLTHWQSSQRQTGRVRKTLSLRLLATGLITLMPMIPLASASTDTPDDALRALLSQTVNDENVFQDRYDAEVWLVDMSGRLSRYLENPAERIDFLRLVHQEAVRAEVDPELVLAIIHIESRFDRFAISRVGAQGLMQVMPFWKKEIGRQEDNLTTVQTNLRYGCTILKYYIDKEKGDLTKALARYNGSTGKTWYPEKVLDAWQKYWFFDRT